MEDCVSRDILATSGVLQTGVDWNQEASAMDQKASATFHTKNPKAPEIPSKDPFLSILYGRL
jgi:hypothetical protein